MHTHSLLAGRMCQAPPWDCPCHPCCLTVLPLPCSWMNNPKQLIAGHSFWVEVHSDWLLLHVAVSLIERPQHLRERGLVQRRRLLLQGRPQPWTSFSSLPSAAACPAWAAPSGIAADLGAACGRYLGLAAASVADDEDGVPHLQQLLQLHHLQHEALLRLQLQLQHGLLNDLGGRAGADHAELDQPQQDPRELPAPGGAVRPVPGPGSCPSPAHASTSPTLPAVPAPKPSQSSDPSSWGRPEQGTGLQSAP